MSIALNCKGQNPIIQDVFTADPAPVVHNDTLFLYTGHDEDSATTKGFIMDDYLCFSTTDMVNWTHHGPVFSTPSLGWAAKHNANAAQVIYRNGKFYYYISPWSALADGGDSIAVGVSDSPYGPFKDALGKPLISPSQTTYSKHLWEDIDPTVWIDDDGQAYLYWGNNSLYCVKLNKDMISYSGDIMAFDIKDKSAFGPDYEEAPWFFKRNDIYYLLYAAHVPEDIYYATSTSPTGPWKYGGVVMDAKAQGSIGNHPGIVQYKGNWYFFYMNQDLTGGHDKRRSVDVIQFEFNPDGSIPKLLHSKAGITKPVGTLNPFNRVEAETMAWEEGIETEKNNEAGMYVTDIDNGDYIKVRNVDFKSGAKSFEANTASVSGGSIEVRLDSLTGTLLGTCMIKNSGGLNKWATVSAKVKQVKGTHDVFFVFKGGEGDLFNFNWWKFSK
ncbi:MAG: family 43 glycosylhydrolase [Bacteroidia bacterium]|nr:family 43 glycosylhydrolase [Bacteroidia bacterium]